MYTFLSPANRCPRLQLQPQNHSFLSSKDVREGTVVVVQCYRGYLNENGARTKAIRCMSNDKWNATIGQCLGVYLIYRF